MRTDLTLTSVHFRRTMLSFEMGTTSSHLRQLQSSLEDAIDSLIALRSNVKTLHKVIEVSFVLLMQFFCCL